MATPATDGKSLVNHMYHGAVVAGLAIGYAKLSKKVSGGTTPKLDLTICDTGMVAADVAFLSNKISSQLKNQY